jgi:histone acetyltransferase 1
MYAGARMLEGADHNWEIIALLVPDSNDEALAGFAAVHSFYAWPDRRRIRIAQLAVLPPFRNRGIASALLEEIRMLSLDRRYVDMTFEDPSDQLLTIRGTLDVTKVKFHLDNCSISKTP